MSDPDLLFKTHHLLHEVFFLCFFCFVSHDIFLFTSLYWNMFAFGQEVGPMHVNVNILKSDSYTAPPCGTKK